MHAGTRIVLVYGLTTRASLPDTSPLSSLYDYGRFTAHLEASESLLPRVVFDYPVGDLAGAEPLGLTSVRAILTVTPRGDLTLMLDVEMVPEATTEFVARMLAATCFRRGEMTVDGTPLLDWASAQVDADCALEFGRDVHQMVFPGGALLDQLYADQISHPDRLSPAAAQVIYRGTRQIASGIRIPGGLNNPGQTVLAHGRGVSVAAGWGAEVETWGDELENTYVVGVLVLVAALEVVQRVRRAAFASLTTNSDAMLESTEDARTLVSRLSSELNEMQLDLSFGVEAYIDSVLIPEFVVEGFQSSLRDAVGLDHGLANTSRMLERLQAVIETRLSTLEAAAGEQQERSARLMSGLFGAGSLMALPPALLLAFFGLNGQEVSEQWSIFDFGHYWLAYLVVWVPFLALAVVGVVLQRRIRASSPQLTRSRRRR
ncbi:phage holin family protein [Amycolatopsis sp. CA-230715]|uniref:phage holin family protein n=1 Tax=Amycolatopsis sp. CA-230715 TaxID=2745196 RepID=UPI001C037986|nr:phage holin family protein [Amycolatopsis sp. CA-230715]QWF80317.1 hypothetical protein HUW46_03737 [Amycolatopsis sp. CA-230715]